jgi:hypothetical protein
MVVIESVMLTWCDTWTARDADVIWATHKVGFWSFNGMAWGYFFLGVIAIFVVALSSAMVYFDEYEAWAVFAVSFVGVSYLSWNLNVKIQRFVTFPFLHDLKQKLNSFFKVHAVPVVVPAKSWDDHAKEDPICGPGFGHLIASLRERVRIGKIIDADAKLARQAAAAAVGIHKDIEGVTESNAASPESAFGFATAAQRSGDKGLTTRSSYERLELSAFIAAAGIETGTALTHAALLEQEGLTTPMLLGLSENMAFTMMNKAGITRLGDLTQIMILLEQARGCVI